MGSSTLYQVDIKRICFLATLVMTSSTPQANEQSLFLLFLGRVGEGYGFFFLMGWRGHILFHPLPFFQSENLEECGKGAREKKERVGLEGSDGNNKKGWLKEGEGFFFGGNQKSYFFYFCRPSRLVKEYIKNPAVTP